MIVVVDKGIGDPSSNPRLGCLYFTSFFMRLGKTWVKIFSIQLRVNNGADFFDFKQSASEKENFEFKQAIKIGHTSHPAHGSEIR